MRRPLGAVKPPFAYYGGKTTLASTIADLLPAHKHYVEPFQDPSRRGPMGMPQYLEAYVERMAPAVDRIRRVSLECRDALTVIREYGQHEQVCIYADPPYLGSTRSSRQYVVEMSQQDEHEALAEALQGCRAAVVLSGYHSPLYDALYARWEVHELAAFTGQANTKGHRTEVLWSNRPIGQDRLL